MKLRKKLDEQTQETDKLKNRVRVNRSNEEHSTRTIEYLTTRVGDLEHRLEEEKNKGRLPSAEVERLEKTHRTEVNSVKSMFKALILKKDEEIKELDQITKSKIRDFRNLYDSSEQKDKKVKELEKKIQHIENDLETEKERLNELRSRLELKETEIVRCSQNLNNS